MAAKGPPEENPVRMVKLVARDMLDGIFDDLIEKRVLHRDELYRVEEGIDYIMNDTEHLVEDIFEKAKMSGKIVADHIINSKQQLSLKFDTDDDDDESQENSASSSSTTESIVQEGEEMENAADAYASGLMLTDPQQSQAAKTNDTLTLCPQDHFHKLKTEKAEEIYPVMEKEGQTCLALIICNIKFKYLFDRSGAEVDLLNMKDLLQNFGYSVVVKENLTAQEMKVELKQFALRPEHESSDSTFLVFMSHSILEGICGTKHRKQEPDILHDDSIFTIFNNCNCWSLRDKRKVIIMQACRGRGNGIVWVSTSRGIGTADTDDRNSCYNWNGAIKKAHVEKDFIAFKSSTPHNISWKLGTSGSLFISQLIFCFRKYSWCYHLEEIFRKVQHSFETPSILTQMPTIERVSMTRYFYLFPGN
uniref:caspase-12-like n=1 Tax=Jaculus jaculus TaxID=51337 RepID=UPI001E1B442D|nr:caspase-12-like [Jaculus jaculus]